jgi:hypothetical protein
MKQFIPGMELSHRFYGEVVKPLVEQEFRGLAYTAGLIDYGSDVLGFDTEVSIDHQWGPRLSLFLKLDDIADVGPRLDKMLGARLPAEFLGFSTNFSGTRADYIRHMEHGTHGHVKHLIRIHTAEEFFLQHLGIDIHGDIRARDWLVYPQQRLATIRSGRLFCDGLEVSRIKEQLKYYPDDVWYYLMAAEWAKISAEEAFVGRCGNVDDELGSRLIAARMVTRLMNLHFLQQREYIPYSKWFGTAFQKLPGAGELKGVFTSILGAADWKEREKHLSIAYGKAGRNHNALRLTEEIDTTVRNFHEREYLVISAGNFADSLYSVIKDPELATLKRLGNIDQITDNSSILEHIEVARRATHLYESGP